MWDLASTPLSASGDLRIVCLGAIQDKIDVGRVDTQVPQSVDQPIGDVDITKHTHQATR